MTPLRAVVWKEFLHIVRERRLLGFIFGAPVLLLVLFGYALRLKVENLPMAVLDLDKSIFSLQILDTLRSEGGFRVLEVASEEDMRRMLHTGEARLGLIVPADLADRLTRNETATLRLLVDGSMPTLAMMAMYGAGVLTGDELTANLYFADPDKDAPPPRAPPIRVDREILFNPELRDTDFFLPGIIGIVIMQVTLILASISIVREREQRTMEQLMATPVSRSAFVVGKLIPYAVISAVDFAVVIGAGHLLFDLPFAGPPALIVVLAVLYILSLLALGAFISSYSQTQPQAVFLAIFVLLPSVLLSGFVFPIEAMPEWLQPVPQFIPMTYYLDAIRALTLKGTGFGIVAKDFAALGAFGLVFTIGAILRFKKTG
ncbi:MAG: ABC transporter permease [Nitrospirae bacterium]|nr:ABC transporter permease [Nitrospirota bacterium]